MGTDGDESSVFSELVSVLHSAVVLMRVADRVSIGRIHEDVAAAAAMLRRGVIHVGRRTDVQDPPVGSPRRARLSPRERLIVGALIEGRSYKDVAQDLGMSLSSVQARVKSIYAKLGVHSKAELRAVWNGGGGGAASGHAADEG